MNAEPTRGDLAAPRALIVYTTVPDEATATDLAEALIIARVAACVQIVPGLRSVYRWHDSVRNDAEVQLAIKTTVERFDALEATLRRHHPYDLPEIVAVSIVAGSRAYLAWVAEESGGADVGATAGATAGAAA